MNMMSIALAAAIGLGAVPAFAQDGATDARSGAETLLAQFAGAWIKADGAALASLFAADADLITPYGDLARGHDEIQAFYAGAFKRGYAGSQARGDLVSVRLLAPDVALIDARWTIGAATKGDGTARPEEKGILVGVLGKSTGGAWQILALRENASATDIKPIDTPR